MTTKRSAGMSCADGDSLNKFKTHGLQLVTFVSNIILRLTQAALKRKISLSPSEQLLTDESVPRAIMHGTKKTPLNKGRLT